ncbi:uncharacterized protein [Lolium perenne]|uniref:uncharacterized protein isoform X3 n=1 Tax=Lolium perenne TaxID=4522 RepID=UPI0021F5AB39|nr:uncharacterized protein LOC127342345 isoform X4 [Lolium perenne]
MPSRPSHSRATPQRYASSKTRTSQRTSGGCSPSPPSSTFQIQRSSSATPPGQPAPPRGSTSDGSLPSLRYPSSPFVPSTNLRAAFYYQHRSQVNLCGHATLASAHFLFKNVLAEHGMVEFMTRSGILTAKKVTTPGSVSEEEQGKLFIELDFPMDSFVGCNTADDMPLIPETLNGASVVSIHKSKADGDLIVELSSAKEVADIVPSIDEIKRLDNRGLIVTGPAPAGSGYDFFTRFFCPKFGIDEDPVTGSIHCVLAPYWGRKLEKQKLAAYQVCA